MAAQICATRDGGGVLNIASIIGRGLARVHKRKRTIACTAALGSNALELKNGIVKADPLCQ